MLKKKKYSIYDVAKKAGVGIATVSRVLNNSNFVKTSTREEILEVIKELDYSPDFFARNLVKKTSKTIGLLIPDIINPVFSEMAKGISDKAFDNNYTVYLCDTDSSAKKEIEFVKNLLGKNVEGIIFISTEMSKYDGDFEQYLYLHKKNIPIVFINGILKNTDIPFVRINEVKAGYIAANYMLKKGLRKIAFLGGPTNFIPTIEKVKGYTKAFKEFGLNVNKKYIILNNFTIESGYRGAIKLLEMDDKPEGIITASDVLAIEVVKASNLKGIKIPSELEVIGFDDIGLASVYNPSITTIAQPKYYMGAIALNMLVDLINKKELKKRNVLINPELIIRETCT